MRGFQQLQVAAVAVSTLCLLGISAVLGRGTAPFSAAPLGLVAGMRVLFIFWLKVLGVLTLALWPPKLALLTHVHACCRCCSWHGGVVHLRAGFEKVHLSGV